MACGELSVNNTPFLVSLLFFYSFFSLFSVGLAESCGQKHSRRSSPHAAIESCGRYQVLSIHGGGQICLLNYY